jgi:hypothetical protein
MTGLAAATQERAAASTVIRPARPSRGERASRATVRQMLGMNDEQERRSTLLLPDEAVA